MPQSSGQSRSKRVLTDRGENRSRGHRSRDLWQWRGHFEIHVVVFVLEVCMTLQLNYFSILAGEDHEVIAGDEDEEIEKLIAELDSCPFDRRKAFRFQKLRCRFVARPR